ncbi:hypothetical protein Y032_0021g259 [Ancylostoma ceylanicum]|uniref:Uncharacterized protein n=1 Tax=Ancylostoma ceylanicum TaxID=53326 RepID=A0A016V0M1_9BILA|nr:hypothetical protein Y032_0021g259 [Ancylostoma ceylanicum]
MPSLLHFATSASKSSGVISLGHETGAERVDLAVVATLPVMDSQQFPPPPDPQSYSSLPPISSFFSMYPPAFQPYGPPVQDQNYWYSGFPTTTSLTSTYNAGGFSQEHGQLTKSQPFYSTAFPSFISSTSPLCNLSSFLPDAYSSPQAGPSFSGTDAASHKTYTPLLPVVSGHPKEESSAHAQEEKPKVQSSTAAVEESREVTDVVDVPQKRFPAIVVRSSDGLRPVYLYNLPNMDRCYSFSYSRRDGRFDMHYCNGCYESVKMKVTVHVSTYFFHSDPTRLEHVCTPKLLIQEISKYTGRTVKLPLTKYLVVQKVITKQELTKQSASDTEQKPAVVQLNTKNTRAKPAILFANEEKDQLLVPSLESRLSSSLVPLLIDRITFNLVSLILLPSTQCNSTPKLCGHLLEDFALLLFWNKADYGFITACKYTIRPVKSHFYSSYSSRFLSSFRLMPVQRGIRRQVDIAYIYFMADGSVAVLFPNHDFYRSIPRELTESVAFFPVFITRFY